MKTYYIAGNADFYGNFEKCVFDMDEINRLAEEWETTADELIDKYDITEADDEEISELASASGIESMIVYVARISDGNSDAYKVSFDKEEAAKAADQYAGHLTAEERTTHTVSIESYLVPVVDGWTAKAAYDAACRCDILTDPEEYEEV